MKYRYAVIAAVLALFVSHAAMAGPFDFFRPRTLTKPAPLVPTQPLPIGCAISVTVPLTDMTMNQPMTSDDVGGKQYWSATPGRTVRLDYEFKNCPEGFKTVYFYESDVAPDTVHTWKYTVKTKGSLCFRFPNVWGNDDAGPNVKLVFAAEDPIENCYEQTGDDACPEVVYGTTPVYFAHQFNKAWNKSVPEVVSCSGISILPASDLRMKAR